MAESDQLAKRVAATLLAAPTVAALVAGPTGESTAALPGPAVPGVHVEDDRVEVHVAVVHGPPLADVASDLDRRLRPLLVDRRLTVHIDDIQLPGEDLSVPVANSRTEATS